MIDANDIHDLQNAVDESIRKESNLGSLMALSWLRGYINGWLMIKRKQKS